MKTEQTVKEERKVRMSKFKVFCVLAVVSTMFLAGSVMASAMPALRTDKPLKTPLEQPPFPWPNWEPEEPFHSAVIGDNGFSFPIFVGGMTV
jgi:hypothetical protein